MNPHSTKPTQSGSPTLRFAELSGQIDSMRQRLTKMGNLAKVGKEVYEADAVAFEPFSPGKHLGPNARTSQTGQRTQAMNALGSLIKLDAGAGAFYEKRRSSFSKSFSIREERVIFLRSRPKRRCWKTSPRMNRRPMRRQNCWRPWDSPSAAAFPASRSSLRLDVVGRRFLRRRCSWIRWSFASSAFPMTCTCASAASGAWKMVPLDPSRRLPGHGRQPAARARRRRWPFRRTLRSGEHQPE
jgi:hypothetical protein